MIDPGRMRDRVRVQRKRADDAWSKADDQFETIGDVWCEFRPMSGREYREGSAPVGEERATFTLNYREDLRQVDRVIHLGRGGDRKWDVTSVQPLNFKDGLNLFAVAVDAGGN